jgi:DNA-binding transcriptional MocR family regulator
VASGKLAPSRVGYIRVVIPRAEFDLGLSRPRALAFGVDAGVRRPEPFQLALSGLRARLRQGVYAPGARIAATEVADQLGLSATPVREAMSRLAGEGLLEDRRGQGVFVRQLSGGDIADLYRLNLAHLLIAQDPHRRHVTRRPPAAETGTLLEGSGDPVATVERLFADWVAEGASRALIRTHVILQVQLGPVRRLEPLVLRDLDAEAADLDSLQGPDATSLRLHRLRRFHARRLRVASALAGLLEEGERPEDLATLRPT